MCTGIMLALILVLIYCGLACLILYAVGYHHVSIICNITSQPTQLRHRNLFVVDHWSRNPSSLERSERGEYLNNGLTRTAKFFVDI